MRVFVSRTLHAERTEQEYPAYCLLFMFGFPANKHVLRTLVGMILQFSQTFFDECTFTYNGLSAVLRMLKVCQKQSLQALTFLHSFQRFYYKKSILQSSVGKFLNSATLIFIYVPVLF